MRKPSKQQIASVRSALREMHAELLGWDPHVLVAFGSEAQKVQIIARMRQLGWHRIDDPGNETADVSLIEFSLDATAQSATHSSHRTGDNQKRRVRFPASFFAAFGTIAALAGIVIAIATFYTDYRMEILDKAGTPTIGQIERTYFTSGRGGRTYYVSYKFFDRRGISHEGEDPYPFDGWNGLRKGDPIEVTYLANEPERNNLTRRVRLITGRSPKEEIILIGIPWIIACCFFVCYWMRRRSS